MWRFLIRGFDYECMDQNSGVRTGKHGHCREVADGERSPLEGSGKKVTFLAKKIFCGNSAFDW